MQVVRADFAAVNRGQILLLKMRGRLPLTASAGLVEFFSVVILWDGFVGLGSHSNVTLTDHQSLLWDVVSKAVAEAEAKDPWWAVTEQLGSLHTWWGSRRGADGLSVSPVDLVLAALSRFLEAQGCRLIIDCLGRGLPGKLSAEGGNRWLLRAPHSGLATESEGPGVKGKKELLVEKLLRISRADAWESPRVKTLPSTWVLVSGS